MLISSLFIADGINSLSKILNKMDVCEDVAQVMEPIPNAGVFSYNVIFKVSSDGDAVILCDKIGIDANIWLQ